MVEGGAFLGTPKRPQIDAVKMLAKKLREAMAPFHKMEETSWTPDKVAEFHNLYTSYTALLLMFSTGTRPVWGFSRPHIIDPDETPGSDFKNVPGWNQATKRNEKLKPEFCTWRDKDGPDGYHTRLLWMTTQLRVQLVHYQRYLDRLLKHAKCDKENKATLSKLSQRTFFFLRSAQEGLLPEEISPQALKEAFAAHDYHAPTNANRSFLKSEWLEHDGPPDVIELFLGHWDRGEEGFTASSALHPADYKDCLDKILRRKILPKLGIVVVQAPIPSLGRIFRFVGPAPCRLQRLSR